MKEEPDAKQQQLLLLSPVSGSVSNAVLSSPVQPTQPLEKIQFTVQSKSEQSLRPIFSFAGQQRKSFNAMSDFTSVKPIADLMSKSSFRRNSLQTTPTSTEISSIPRTGLSRLLSADLSSAEFYASTGWPKLAQPKEKLISPSIRIKKGLPAESTVIEEEKDSERDSQASVVAPLLSERLKAEYEQSFEDKDEKQQKDKDEKQLEVPGEEEVDDYDSDYDDYDYDIEENFKYAKRDSQISQTMLSNLDPSLALQPEGEKKLSRGKRLTQKGKKVRRTVFKLSKRIKRKLNGSDKDKDRNKDDEKSQSLELKEDKPSISFLDRLTPSPKISKGKQAGSSKSSYNEPSQEFVSCLTDREGSSINEETKEDKKATKEKEDKKDKKEIVDENYQNTKRKLLSRPRALSNIAASLRFAPIPAIGM